MHSSHDDAWRPSSVQQVEARVRSISWYRYAYCRVVQCSLETKKESVGRIAGPRQGKLSETADTGCVERGGGRECQQAWQGVSVCTIQQHIPVWCLQTHRPLLATNLPFLRAHTVLALWLVAWLWGGTAVSLTRGRGVQLAFYAHAYAHVSEARRTSWRLMHCLIMYLNG